VSHGTHTASPIPIDYSLYLNSKYNNMRNQSRLILAFIAGAAAGAAVAYLVTSDKGEEMLGEIRNLAGKIKTNVSDRVKQATGNQAPEAEGEDFMGV
jgi:hypothetical protein